MDNSVHQLLERVSSRARKVWLAHGVCWTIAIGLSATIGLVWLDWVVRPESAGARWVVSGVWLGVLGWLGWQRVLMPMVGRLGDLELARIIERLKPESKHALTSAVEFSEGGSRADGSEELRERVVDRAVGVLSEVDPRAAVSSRIAKRAAVVCGVVAFISALVAQWNREKVGIGMARLMRPWSQISWAQKNRLRLLDSDLAAVEGGLRAITGEPLTVYVDDQNERLPETAVLLVSDVDDQVVRQPLRRTSLRVDGAMRDLFVGSITLQKGPVNLRAEGGDDQSMGWHRVEVGSAPSVSTLRVRVVPPVYSGLTPQDLPVGVGDVQCLVGSQVEISATTNVRVAKVSLLTNDREPIEAKIDGEGNQIRTGFDVTAPGEHTWWLELSDEHGVRSRQNRKFSLRGVVDAPPNVYFEKPERDIEATPEAIVPLKIMAQDDLQLAEVGVWFEIPSVRPPEEIKIAGPEKLGNRVTLEHEWNLGELKVQPGDQIVAWGEAIDSFAIPGQPPHHVRSGTRMILIVDAATKLQELTGRESSLLAELEQAASLQRQVMERVEELKRQAANEKAPEFKAEALNRLYRDQQNVANRLKNNENSLTNQLRRLMDEFERNRLQDDSTRSRLEQMEGSLQPVLEDFLPTAEGNLNRLRKQAGAGSSDESQKSKEGEEGSQKQESSEKATGTTASELLENARGAQQQSLSALESMQDLLGQWKQRQNIIQALTRIRDQQRNLRQQTGSLAMRSLSANGDEQGKQGGEQGESESGEQGEESNAQEGEQSPGGEDGQKGGGSQQKQRNGGAQKRGSQGGRQQSGQAGGEQQGEEGQSGREQESQGEPATPEQLAQQQSALAREVDRLAERLTKAQGEAGSKQGSRKDAEGEEEPGKETSEQLRKKGLANRMRDAAESLRENAPSRAGELQEGLMRDLEEMSGDLEPKPGQMDEEMLKSLEQAMQDVQQLRKLQKELQEAMSLLKENPDAAQLTQRRQQQGAIREELQRLTRRMQQNGSMRGMAQSGNRAGRRMQEAEDAMEAGDMEEVERLQDEVRADLEQMMRELEDEAEELRETLAQESLLRAAENLKPLVERQEALTAETERLAKQYEATQRWTRTLSRSLKDHAENQRGLAKTVGLVEEDLQQHRVISHVLKKAIGDQNRAADLLDEKKVDSGTTGVQRSAAKKLQQIIAAAMRARRSAENAAQQGQQGQQGQGQQQGEQGGGPNGESLDSTELVLLKGLQEELNTRAAELRGSKKPEAEIKTEAEGLSMEQSALAELARQILNRIEEERAREEAEAGEEEEAGGSEQMKKEERSIDDLPDSDVPDGDLPGGEKEEGKSGGLELRKK